MTMLPVPLRPRHDGWTPERQAGFIEALGETASVTQAAARVGMSVQSVYWLRRQPGAVSFRQAWAHAVADAWGRVEETAIERAVHGETEVYERDGVTITRHKPCSPQLLTQMLDRGVKARGLARKRTDAIAAERFQATIARIRREIRGIGDPKVAEAVRLEDERNGPWQKLPDDSDSVALEELTRLLAALVHPDMLGAVMAGPDAAEPEPD